MLEDIVGTELCICGCNVGPPGSMNHIKLLDSSNIVQKIIEGEIIPEYKFTMNTWTRNPHILS